MHPIVRVVWRDSHAEVGWVSRDQAKPTFEPITSVGRLFHIDDDWVTLYHSTWEPNGDLLGVEHIPRACVISIDRSWDE
jgi:hypothetical protein